MTLKWIPDKIPDFYLSMTGFEWNGQPDLAPKNRTVQSNTGLLEQSPVNPIDSSNGGQRVCCWALCGQNISIDSCGRRAAGAGAQQQMWVASRWQPTEETRAQTCIVRRIVTRWSLGCPNKQDAPILQRMTESVTTKLLGGMSIWYVAASDVIASSCAG